MKRFINTPIKIALFAITLIILLVLASFFIADDVLSQKQKDKLGMEKSIEIALDNAELEENQVHNLNSIYSNKGTSPVYEIYFESDSHKFSYTINAHSGEILRFSKNQVDVSAPSDNNNVENDNSADNPNTSPALIDIETAKSIVLLDAKLDINQVSFTKSKLDKDDALYIYEIEFDYKSLSYEYEIDAYSGAILDKEIDD